MKTIAFLMTPVVLLFAIASYAQKLDKEGEAWLGQYAEDAAINVNGVWQSKDWGPVTLNQAEGSRELTGDGDGWNIKGVVSGTNVYLLFHWKGKVEYSAELAAEGENKLTGSYSSKIMTAKSKKKPMLLTK